MTDVHDRFVKAALSDARMTAALLQAALPRQVAEKLAVVSWVPAAGESVDRALANRRADLVFSGETSDGPLLLHIEHQSRPDPYLALRMGIYQWRLWDAWLRSQQPLPAPAIVSLVLYNGTRLWQRPTLDETCNVPSGVAHTRVGFTLHEVGDLYRSERVTDPLLRVALHALWAGVRSSLPLIDSIAPSLDALAERPSDSNDLHVVEALVRYLCSVRPHEGDSLVTRLLARLPTPYQDMAETTLEYIERQAEARGEARGRARGIDLGARQAYQELARRLLAQGFSTASVAETMGLTTDELEALLLEE